MTDKTREKLREIAGLIQKGHTVTLPEDAPAGCPMCRAYVKLRALLEAEEEGGADFESVVAELEEEEACGSFRDDGSSQCANCGWHKSRHAPKPEPEEGEPDLQEEVEAIKANLVRLMEREIPCLKLTRRRDEERIEALEDRVDRAEERYVADAGVTQKWWRRIVALENVRTPEPDSEPEPERCGFKFSNGVRCQGARGHDGAHHYNGQPEDEAKRLVDEFAVAVETLNEASTHTLDGDEALKEYRQARANLEARLRSRPSEEAVEVLTGIKRRADTALRGHRYGWPTALEEIRDVAHNTLESLRTKEGDDD